MSGLAELDERLKCHFGISAGELYYTTTKWAWAKLTKGKMAAARKGRLRTLAQEASVEGPLRCDEAYMKSANASGPGQAGQWAGVVPAFGTRVRFRRYGLGLLDGAAQMVVRRTHRFESARQDLPSDVLDCPHCGVLEYS